MRIIILIFGIIFWANLFAQNNFYSTYDYNLRNDFGVSIIEPDSTSLVTFGMTTRGGFSMKFLKLNISGSAIYQKHYQTLFDDLNGGKAYLNTKMIGYGSHYDPIEGSADGHIIILNLNGDSLKLINVDLEWNDRIHDVLVRQDSTFVLFGIYHDSLNTDAKPYVANIDTFGNAIWFKAHSKSGFAETIVNLQPTPDGGYIFSGTEEETPNGHTDLFLTKVDSVGNLVWKQYYHEAFSQRGGHVEVLRDGNFAMFGTGYTPHNADRAILKINGSTGSLIWRQKHGTNLDEGYIVGKELPNGNFICAGTSIRMYNNQQIDDVNLSMLDSAGNQLWSRDYNYHGLGTNEYVKDLIITSDGGFAMTGFILNAPGGTGNDVFVLKTDTNGLITSLNSGFREVTPDMRVYPNPTKDIVNIPYVVGLESIEVYNVAGKLLQDFVDFDSPPKVGQAAQSDKSNESVNKINLSNYEAGIYILKLTMKNGEVFSKKVIKE